MKVLFNERREYNSVIDVDTTEMLQARENHLHDTLRSGWGIALPKRHYNKLKLAMVGGKDDCEVVTVVRH